MAGLTPTRGVLRGVRGALLALTSAGLAVAAHVLAHGMAPDTGLTVLLTVGIAAGGIALADRQRGPVAMLVALGTAQLGMHLILSIPGTGMGEMAPPADGLLMTGAHVVSVLLAAVLLTHAESALFALAGALRRLLPRRLSAPPVPEAPAVAPYRHAPADRGLAVLLSWCCTRRGPPVPC